MEWRWRRWFDAGPVQELRNNCRELAAQGITEETAVAHNLGSAPRPVTSQTWQKARRGIQAATTTLLRRRAWRQHGRAAFDRKVRNWKGPALLPGRRVDRCRRVMAQLPPSTPPRVRAALLRTWLNGWCTGRRFGIRGGRCAYGCQHGEDAIQHYLGCPVLWKFGVEQLGLSDPATPEGRVSRLLLWDGAAADQLRAAALLLAVGYKTYNVLRHRAAGHGQPPPEIHRLLMETLRLTQATGRPTRETTTGANSSNRGRRTRSPPLGGERNQRRRLAARRSQGASAAQE